MKLLTDEVYVPDNTHHVARPGLHGLWLNPPTVAGIVLSVERRTISIEARTVEGYTSVEIGPVEARALAVSLVELARVAEGYRA